MRSLLFQASGRGGGSILNSFRHVGVLGLFSLAILDSSPVPTFAGADILLIVLVATKRHPWYEYAGSAVAGSIMGAWLTFALARKTGAAYRQKHSEHDRLCGLFEMFKTRAGVLLAVSTAIPFPFPTSAMFAAAGASGYPAARFLVTVSVCRALRYTGLAILADTYGRTFALVLRHPLKHWHWLVLLLAIAAILTWIALNLKLRLKGEPQGMRRKPRFAE
jgi:membrane protein YqaA with SNARE-associated domain